MAADSRLSHRVFGTPGSERLVVLVGTGGLVYAAATVLTGAVRPADLKRLIRRPA